ncbi:MAG: hypothetical protein NTW32_12230 [Chloroflexi bacterium]|nr:hypothetical protein [Chloroflexota bacterium]
MTINSKILAVLVVVILFGGILISSGLGWWQTESNKVAATFTEGEFAGQANPADIRGSYTFGDVEKNFGIPVAVMGQAFNVKTDPANFQAKGLEGVVTLSGVEIGTSSIRLFVAFYKNLPFDLTSDIYLPETAVLLLKERPLTPEQSKYLETHSAVLRESTSEPTSEPGSVTEPAAPAVSAPTTAATPQAASTPASVSTDRIIKGKTTFGELLSWGAPKANVEKIIGMPIPADAAANIKNFCASNNLDFETIKPALQAEVK